MRRLVPRNAPTDTGPGPLDRSAWRLAAILGTATIAACGDPTGPRSLGPPGLTIVAGAGAADTAHAVLPQALIVELRDDAGRPIAGAEVRFSEVPTEDPALAHRVTVWSRPIDFPHARRESLDTTDAGGRARVQVVLGSIAGTARLAVRVTSTGAADTAEFTVRPGNPSQVVANLQDTTIVTGAVLRVTARVTDQSGNLRDDAPVSFAASDGISVDAAGNASGAAPVRGVVVASNGAIVDTVRLSVVPPWTFAAVLQEESTHWLVTLRLDGTGVQKLTTLRGMFVRPSWHPAGDRLVFEDIDPADSGNRLYLVDLQGQRRRAIAPVPGLDMEWYGRFSPDGQQLYFHGYDSENSHGTSWRARADGSSAETVPLPPGVTITAHPDPSPDGIHVAINGLGIQDAAGTRVRWLPVSGISPRFSPDGQRLLYSSLSKTLSVVNLDGTGARELVTAHGYAPEFPPSWSADGNWILVRAEHRLELVRVSTGEIIPLIYSSNLHQPSLRW